MWLQAHQDDEDGAAAAKQVGGGGGRNEAGASFISGQRKVEGTAWIAGGSRLWIGARTQLGS